MKFVCPKCRAAIDGASVNVAADLAKCESCGELFKASELLEDFDEKAAWNPPAGSKISFRAERGELGTFLIPSTGLTSGHIFPLIFVVFWTGFVAFWTLCVAFASGSEPGGPPAVFPLLFSIPFWAVGISMLAGLLNSIKERQEIEVGPDALRIAKIRPILPKQHSIPYAEIGSLSVESTMPTNPFTFFRQMPSVVNKGGMPFFGLPCPTIAHGVKKARFAENVSDAEKEWLVKVLKAVVSRKRGRIV